MLLVAAMDEGPLLAQSVYDIPDSCDTPTLTAALIELSGQALKTILPEYYRGAIQPAPQEQVTMAASNEPTYSRKLSKADGDLDWHKPAIALEREVRAYLEWPRSRTVIDSTEVVITKAHVEIGTGDPGTVWKKNKQLGFYTAQGILAIDSLVPSGKKEMPISAFLAGHQQI